MMEITNALSSSTKCLSSLVAGTFRLQINLMFAGRGR